MRNEMMKEESPTQAMLWSGGGPASLPRDAADVADAIRQASATGTPLRITGAGSWLDAGRPTDPLAARLDVSAIRGIVEYVPGDLTITARAGTSLAEIASATAPFGQWLPLDPWGDPRGTLGATLATASAGPLAAHLGHPRDLTLGVAFVDGRGALVHGGGRVVKNVAGFDLVRLSVGAWGTLGVITEATMRLRARPECEETLALHVPRDPRALASVLGSLRSAPLAPIAMELVDQGLASHVGASHDGPCVLVRLSGNAASVSAQRAAVSSLGTTEALAHDAWATWHTAGVSPGDWTFRCSTLPSALAGLWDVVGGVVGAPFDGWRHASVDRGIIRVVIPAAQRSRVASLVSALATHGRLVGERLPDEAWDRLASAAGDRLSLGVRRAFDPHHLLNRGILEGFTPA